MSVGGRGELEAIDVVTEVWKVFETHTDGIQSYTTEWDVHTENLWDIIREVDLDGDGFLQWPTGEMMAFIRRIFLHHGLAVPPLPHSTWVGLFQECDANKDGRLDFSEAANFVLQVYNRVLGYFPEAPPC